MQSHATQNVAIAAGNSYPYAAGAIDAMRSLVLVAFATYAGLVQAQEVIYVDRDATGAGDGTSWADAFTALPSAIAASLNGDEIWVAEGVYTPTESDSRAATFLLRGGVALYGGFSGTEVSRDQRDPALHVTALSGEIGDPGSNLDNSTMIVRAHGTGPGTRLDGFTVAGAYGTGGIFIEGYLTIARCHIRDNYTNNIGGGLIVMAPTFYMSDTVIENNRAAMSGGGAYLVVGTINIHRTLFRGNEALSPTLGGGGMYVDGSADVTMSEVEFSENSAHRGGGLYSEDDALEIARGRFTRNAGGGLYLERTASLVNVAFEGNVTNERGGGVAAGPLAPAVRIHNAAFVGNRAAYGGGLHLDAGASAIVGTATFAANEATVDGDGAYAEAGASGVMRNAITWENALEPAGLWMREYVVDSDPLFVAEPSAGTDGQWGTPDDDYGDLRLASTSPAIDAGLTSLLPPDEADLDGDGDMLEPLPIDLDDEARVAGASVDAGAYERQTPSGTPSDPAQSGLSVAVTPNPATGTVAIRVDLPTASSVSIALFDALGRRVAVVHDGALAAGWQAFVIESASLPAGVYVIRVLAGDTSATRRLTIQ